MLACVMLQMLRRSVELKDWLGCGEPRSVRRVMRTVLEEISTIDTQVSCHLVIIIVTVISLYESTELNFLISICCMSFPLLFQQDLQYNLGSFLLCTLLPFPLFTSYLTHDVSYSCSLFFLITV